MGKFLAENYGKTVNRNAFDAAVAKSWGKENVKAVKLSCHGNPAYLTEIQLSLKADNINQTLSAQSFLPQPHPGKTAVNSLLSTKWDTETRDRRCKMASVRKLSVLHGHPGELNQNGVFH